MNIAILDYTLSKTHIRFNIANFEQLSKFANLYILNCDHYYDKFAQKHENVKLYQLSVEDSTKPMNALTSRLCIMKNMKLNKGIFHMYNSIHFDAIIIMGFEVLTFSLYRLVVPRNIPIYVFQHQQLDELENWIKRLFYFTYRNSVNHIVLEDHFRDYMKSNLKAKNVYTIHNISYVSGQSRGSINEKWIVGLSSHNDDSIVKEIIEDQENTGFLTKNNVHMYIRSSKLNYEDSNLKVVYEYLSGEDYDELYKKAFAVLTPIPPYFHHRVSGPVIDGITNGKVVLCSNKQIVEMYSSVAPSIIKYFKGVDDLKKLIMEDNWKINENELRAIKSIYSAESVLMEYKQMLLH